MVAIKKDGISIFYGIKKLRIGWCGIVKGDLGVKRIFIGFKSREELIKKIKKVYPEANFNNKMIFEEIRTIENYLNEKSKNILLSLDFSGTTSFQRRVYRTLLQIPYGGVTTYARIAIMCGDKCKTRAVARALATNPFPLAIPCHRVVKSDGSLGGFSSPGGTDLKQWLIRMESANKVAV
jgi:methylated-DNA-[protein]-cysteine S-methyltransferase